MRVLLCIGSYTACLNRIPGPLPCVRGQLTHAVESLPCMRIIKLGESALLKMFFHDLCRLKALTVKLVILTDQNVVNFYCTPV